MTQRVKTFATSQVIWVNPRTQKGKVGEEEMKREGEREGEEGGERGRGGEGR